MFETLAATALIDNDMSTYVALTNLETKDESTSKKKTKQNKQTNTHVEKEVVNSTKDVHTQKALRTIYEMYN